MSAREFIERHRKLESDIKVAVYALLSEYEQEIGTNAESIDIDLKPEHRIGSNPTTCNLKVSVKLDISE